MVQCLDGPGPNVSFNDGPGDEVVFFVLKPPKRKFLIKGGVFGAHVIKSAGLKNTFLET